MAFCSNCGQQLDDKAKFCSACGTSRSVQQTANENKRKTVYEGEIRKCPKDVYKRQPLYPYETAWSALFPAL